MTKRRIKVLPIVRPAEHYPNEHLELSGIDDIDAACVMAIVSYETGIPLDELTFRSIRAVEE